MPRSALSPLAARMLARARRAWSQRQFEAVEHAAANVLALAPDEPEALRLLGMARQRNGKRAAAIECFRRVLARWPDDADLHVCLGIALFEQGATDDAVTHLRHACELTPHSASAWFNLGEALGRQANSADAVVALRRAIDLDPAHLSARLSRARILASMGQIDVAIAGYREVLQRDPENAEGWFGLSNLNTVRFDAADAQRLQQSMQRPNLPPRDFELLSFSRAKALEDQGEFAQAFEVFRAANASRRKRVHWDADGEHRRVAAIERVFAMDMPAPLDAALGREVIFIVSIPRSGSTLVEHILASHPQVEGANEIKDMTEVVDAETRRRDSAFPLWVPDATAQDWQRLGNEYLARTTRWRAHKARHTDKSLVSWYLVGAALAMLPAARIVIVHRDPVETCLACFRQCFSERSGFACDLDEMTQYCIDFLRLARFWRERYPQQVLDLAYETLVNEPEPTIRRLLDFCGLPFDAACLDFHKTSRTVQSLPSAAQVRQPMRRDTARSARYGDKLDRVRERLRDAGVLARA